MPKDVLKTPPFDFNVTATEDEDAAVIETDEGVEEECKFECSRVEYLTKQTFAAIHPPQLESLNLTVE